MRGVPPPGTAPVVPPVTTYTYGVGLGDENQLIPFLVRTGRPTPGDVVEVLEQHDMEGKASEAAAQRNALLKKYRWALAEVRQDQTDKHKSRASLALEQQRSEEARRLEEERWQKQQAERQIQLRAARKLEIGRVAAHSDGQSIHMAILLDVEDECLALFLTSRPGWARQYREMTADERALCGMSARNRTTYLAPVIRPWDTFSMTPKQFPESRVIELREEFKREYAD